MFYPLTVQLYPTSVPVSNLPLHAEVNVELNTVTADGNIIDIFPF